MFELRPHGDEDLVHLVPRGVAPRRSTTRRDPAAALILSVLDVQPVDVGGNRHPRLAVEVARSTERRHHWSSSGMLSIE